MHFLYVDESGDGGAYTEGFSQNTRHFILSGIIINQEIWATALDRLKTCRKYIKEKHGLLLHEEIHAAELIRISKNAAYKQ